MFYPPQATSTLAIQPRLQKTRLLIFGWVVVTLLSTLFSVISIVTTKTSVWSIHFLLSANGVTTLIGLCILIDLPYRLYSLFHFQKFEQKRQEFLIFHPFKRSFPILDNSTPYPFQIEYKLKRSLCILISMFFLLIVSYSISMSILPAMSENISSVFHTQFSLNSAIFSKIVSLLLVSIPTFAFIYLAVIIPFARVRRVVHPQGMGDIAWEDVQMFACYRLAGIQGLEYEIANQRAVISWHYIEAPPAWLEIWTPTTPIETYHQHMQSLVEYISTRTGLPLYDLSGPEPVQVYPPLLQTDQALPQEIHEHGSNISFT